MLMFDFYALSPPKLSCKSMWQFYFRVIYDFQNVFQYIKRIDKVVDCSIPNIVSHPPTLIPHLRPSLHLIHEISMYLKFHLMD